MVDDSLSTLCEHVRGDAVSDGHTALAAVHTGTDIVDDHRGAGRRECPGVGCAQPPPGARHECDSSLERETSAACLYQHRNQHRIPPLGSLGAL